MIKHINTIRLILCISEILYCGQAYVTVRLIIKVVLKLTPELLGRLLGLLSKNGEYVRLTVTLPSI